MRELIFSILLVIVCCYLIIRLLIIVFFFKCPWCKNTGIYTTKDDKYQVSCGCKYGRKHFEEVKNDIQS